MGIGLKIDN